MSLSVRFYDRDGGKEAREDLNDLPTKKLQEVALYWLKKLSGDLSHGKPLGYQLSTGDLTGLHKLYFDEDDEPWNPLWEPPLRPPGDPHPRYRIVYEIHPNEEHPEFIEVISIGPKPQVYWLASDRHEPNDDH